MQLTMREAMRWFDVSETTIQRWIKQLGLPAQEVGGQYRFNRTELLDWATARQIELAVDVFDDPGRQSEPAPGLAEALREGGIFYDVRGADKEAALRAVVATMRLPDGFDRELLLRLLLAREALGSTAVGEGIAIPHVRRPVVLDVPQPMISLCFMKKPIAFGAADGQPVRILFSLICPTVDAHLQLLSRLSYALHDPGFKACLTRRRPADRILWEARRVDNALRQPVLVAGAKRAAS